MPSDLCRSLSMTAEDCVLAPPHLWLHHRDTVVQPVLDDVGGVGGFYCPPVAGRRSRVTLLVDGSPLAASDWEWSPANITRSAVQGDLKFRSKLVALAGGGFLTTVEIANRGAAARSAQIEWRVEPAVGTVTAGKWGWVPPEASDELTAEETAGVATFAFGDRQIAYASHPPAVGSATQVNVEPGGSVTVSLAAALRNDGTAAEQARRAANGAAEFQADVEAAIEAKLQKAFDAYPTIESDNADLVEFYRRGILTFETCLWESESFLLNPHMAESGIDGGAICNYFWGIAYIAKLLAISRPDLLKSHIVQSLRSDPFEHYAYTPADGTSVGPWYSYNQFSLVWCIYQYVKWTNDVDFLRENVAGHIVFDWAKRNALFKDDPSAPVRLIDYGDDHNLLELKRTDAYRHFVPSPNAERCWMYRAVDKMAKLLGLPNPGLGARADELASLIHRELWRDDLGWYGTLDAEGRPRVAWSIQVFDMLRFGVVPPEAARRLAEHLNEDEFLSAHGVHSLAKTDPGYDESDVDWGGPGVYAGDGPELVEDLYLAGLTDHADDLLRRIIWWGRRLPYYPQAIRADAEDYRRDGRANVVAGLKAAETTLFALLAPSVNAEGRVSFAPHLPVWAGSVAFRDLRLLGRRYDVEVDRDEYRVLEDGVEVERGNCR